MSGPMFQVAIVCGGPSSEAAVSRVSAAALAEGLRIAGHSVRVLELEPQLPQLLVELRLRAELDVCFPIAHGAQGEDGCVQGLLEVIGVPYVGSDVHASAVCTSKPTAKRLLQAAGVRVAPERVLARAEEVTLAELRAELGAELFVKPADGGSAIGVTRLDRAATEDALGAALERVFEVSERALVEPLIAGAEATCGVLDSEHGPIALPPTRIVPKTATWYDFEAKYGSAGSRHVCPADFPDEINRALQATAVLAHRAVGARDLSRIDFLVEGDRIVALEVNTLPGFTGTSLFPEAAAAAGIAFPALCDQLVRRAASRTRRSYSAPAMPT